MATERLSRGQIVFVRQLSDDAGRNPTDRRAIIITDNKVLDAGGPIRVVGISARDPEGCPLAVELPYRNQPGGHFRTSLTMRCWARCHWIVAIESDSIDRIAGKTPESELREILKHVATQIEREPLREQDGPAEG